MNILINILHFHKNKLKFFINRKHQNVYVITKHKLMVLYNITINEGMYLNLKLNLVKLKLIFSETKDSFLNRVSINIYFNLFIFFNILIY